MKLFQSIKWRLQIWYGLILVVVLGGFGLTAYQLARDQQFGRIDGELNRRVGILINALHRPPPRAGDFDFYGPPPDGPDRFGGPDRPELREGRRPPIFHLPPEDAHYFDDSDPHDFYFRIIHFHFRRRGAQLDLGAQTEIARSTNFPAMPETVTRLSNEAVNNAPIPFPPAPGQREPEPLKTIDHHRETCQLLPAGEFIEVGCSILPEQHELGLTALRLAVFGGVILLLGLAGGGWLVGRALRPVAEITSAAAQISAGDLTQRINVSETESELGELANVLNSTFTRLEASFAQQKQFTADAAHELRTPVTVILTQTQTTLNRERDAAGYRQALEACQRAAQRMRRLIESLLALARLEAGQEALNRRRFDLAQVVAEAATLLHPLAEASRIKLTTNLEPLEIDGDAERLGQIAANLLANAIQYNRPDGEVRVNLKSENGLAVLTVADNGPGIQAADLPRVFERFYRADASRTGSGNTGLGLAICQAIVTAHAGTLEVASTEKVGTTFTVRLPVG
jgi:signal transduction histidine kinase